MHALILTRLLSQFSVDHSHGIRETNVRVVEVEESAKSAGRDHRNDWFADFGHDWPVHVVSNHSRETPVQKKAIAIIE